jgi:hypothetical protein
VGRPSGTSALPARGAGPRVPDFLLRRASRLPADRGPGRQHRRAARRAEWSILGPTLHLSAFATFDAMSLFLVALAAWLATGARTREDSTGWILAATAALALANAAKYASAIFDPTVIGMACLCAFPRPGGKIAVRRAALLITCLTGVIAVVVKIAGLYYSVGIRQTTLTRIEGGHSVAQVLGESWAWVGIAVVLAAAGAALGIAKQSSRWQKLLLVLLAGTGLLAPLEQARIHTTTLLDKHVGLTQARVLFDWPNTSHFINVLRPIVDDSSGPLLLDTPSVPEYYLPAGAQWRRWSSTWNIRKPNGNSVGSRGWAGAGFLACFPVLPPDALFLGDCAELQRDSGAR